MAKSGTGFHAGKVLTCVALNEGSEDCRGEVEPAEDVGVTFDGRDEFESLGGGCGDPSSGLGKVCRIDIQLSNNPWSKSDVEFSDGVSAPVTIGEPPNKGNCC